MLLLVLLLLLTTLAAAAATAARAMFKNARQDGKSRSKRNINNRGSTGHYNCSFARCIKGHSSPTGPSVAEGGIGPGPLPGKAVAGIRLPSH